MTTRPAVSQVTMPEEAGVRADGAEGRGAARDVRANLLVVALLAVVTAFSAFHEGYTGLVTLPFLAVLLGGIAMAGWLGLSVSTPRLLSLTLAIFCIEYVKEALGVRFGLWVYHGTNGAFLFGVWAWVLGGLACYTLANRVLAPLLARLQRPPSRRWHIGVPIGFAVLALVLMGPRAGEMGWPYWLLYAALLALAIVGARGFGLPLLAGLVVTSWLVGNVSEYLGSSGSGIWTFPRDPGYPPTFLVLACWPIEILAQCSLSMLLVPPSAAEVFRLAGERDR